MNTLPDPIVLWTTTPTLVVKRPSCSHCDVEVEPYYDHLGKGWMCPVCRTWWPEHARHDDFGDSWTDKTGVTAEQIGVAELDPSPEVAQAAKVVMIQMRALASPTMPDAIRRIVEENLTDAWERLAKVVEEGVR